MDGQRGQAREVRKIVTTLFADVTGSTALGDRVDPETLRAVLTDYFDAMRAVIERHGGSIEKFIGDAIMAVFGVPTVHEDDPARAVSAAAEMRDALDALNVGLEQRFGARLAARIGVNTGEVVAGDASTGQSFATGGSVQVAARLEQAAEPGEILLGESTYRLVRDLVDAEPVAPLDLKGKAAPVPAWRLVAVDTEGTAFPRRTDTPFVGRERQLRTLAETLDRTAVGAACALVTLVGEPGVGKSRLVREFMGSNAERARFVVGRCLPYGESITYRPVAEIVDDIGIHDVPALRELLGDDTVVGPLAGAVGLEDTAGSIEETQWATRKLFEALARDRPLVVVLDDVHWAETTFLDLVEYIVDFTLGGPIVLLCVARPDLLDTRPSWTSPRANATVVSLDPLSHDETAALVEGIAPELTADVRDRVLDAAEGNPLFVEHLLAFFAEGGTAPNGIPPSLGALLAARIDALEPGERAVIEVASVEGRRFHRGAVAALVPETAREGLASTLLSLGRKGLVRPDHSQLTGDDAFRFAHVLVREAAYAGVLKLQRAELHRRLADWLEVQAFAPRDRDEVLGYHLETAYRYRREMLSADDEIAELGARAARHLGPAGERALTRGDLAAAVSFLERASAMVDDADPARPELLASLGMARAALGELEAAERILGDAVELAESRGDRRTRERAAVEVTRIRLITGEVGADDAHAVATAATDVLGTLDDDLGLAKAWLLLAFVHNWHLEFSAMERAAREAQLHARRAGALRDAADALAWAGPAMLFGPRPVPDAIAYLEGIAPEAPGPMAEAATLLMLGCLRLMLGEADAGRELYAQSEAVYRDLGVRLLAAAGATLTGWSELVAGDAAVAETLLRAGFDELEEMGERALLSSTAAELARVLCASGRYAEADELLRRGEELTGEGDLFNTILLAGVRARVCTSRGELDDARQAALQAVSLARSADCLELTADAHGALADAMDAAGERDAARQARTEALRLYELKQNAVAAGRIRELME